MEAWEKWDVRGMVLFSLTLQIFLSVLGRRRKYKVSPFLKTILWFAYLGADWAAIATLGKLSGSYTESPATNILRAYWAPLLLLHLGGPDTITAYAFEDNKLWIRHLLILVVKAIFVIYVVCLSWTFSWLSFLSLPLILAGIIKYVEKIWCLKLNNSQEKKPVFSNFFNHQGHPHQGHPHQGHPHHNVPETLNRLVEENPNVLRGYLLFTTLRHDVNDYLSSFNISDICLKAEAYLKETTGLDTLGLYDMGLFLYLAFGPKLETFEVLSVELGFIFDVVYTKAALIYTKLGCLLRLTSFTISFSVLLLFFISIINELKFHGSRIDIAITGILLSGAIALELYAAWVMLSSDWAILVAEFHHNVLVRKMFKVALKCFSRLLRPRKGRLDQMGQFDLLEYCLYYKKRKANQSRGILLKMPNGSEIAEMWHKHSFTKFVNVPSFLKNEEFFRDSIRSSLFGMKEFLKPSRGENTLQRRPKFHELKWSIELGFDHSIIVWHLATSVCYSHENCQDDEAVELSKYVSDYMMYLLVMCPALLFSEHGKSFWLDHTYDELKELLFFATDIRNAASTLVSDDVLEEELEPSEHEEDFGSSETTFKKLQGEVFKLVTVLNESEDKWEMIRDVWKEMLFYAAFSSQHINHVKQLGEGIEFLSLLWLSVGCVIFGLV